MNERVPTRVELLEADIDVRLAGEWDQLFSVLSILPSQFIPMVAAAMRSAYVRGYGDAFQDVPKGRLYSDHGYPFTPPEARS